MTIKDLRKLSLIDFPPHKTCVVATAGCNFRCQFCQEPELVLTPEKLPTIENDVFYDFLRKNKPWLDAVCITGGEPTINQDLPEHMAHIKALGYLIKLETNGTNPDMIEKLIDQKLVDYIAMDVKTTLEKYETIVRVPVNQADLKRTTALLIASCVAYEFRMTVVPTLIEEQDFHVIGQWLCGAEHFYLQQFSNKKCLKRALQSLGQFPYATVEKFRDILQQYIKHVEICSAPACIIPAEQNSSTAEQKGAVEAKIG